MVEDAPRKESNNRKLAVIFFGKISMIENFTRLWNGTRNLPEKGLEGFQGVNDIECKIFFLCLQLNEDDSDHENMCLRSAWRKIHTKLDDFCWIMGGDLCTAPKWIWIQDSHPFFFFFFCRICSTPVVCRGLWQACPLLGLPLFPRCLSGWMIYLSIHFIGFNSYFSIFKISRAWKIHLDMIVEWETVLYKKKTGGEEEML